MTDLGESGPRRPSATRRRGGVGPGGIGRIRPTGVPTVVIVGRPNVGKSTLVNRLVGRRDAIVEERPGVTRDRTAHQLDWRGREVTLLDTGGWTPGWARDETATLDAAISEQSERATAGADLVLLVVDATVGITEEDAAAAGWLRRTGVPVLLVANKVDELGAGSALTASVAELSALGLGDPVPVSALHGRGSGDLLDEVWDRVADAGGFDRENGPRAEVPGVDVPGVAIIGRPNVGKSSLFNRLLGEDRVIVHDAPGTTRDAVDTTVEVADGRAYRFVDTAGLRKHARRGDATEYYSTVRTVQALDRSAVALLVADASDSLGEQEQRLARQIIDAGRGLVLVWNKWDLLDEHRRDRLDREHDRLLGFVSWAPVVRTSAATGRGLDRLLPAIDAALEEWHKRIATAQLNVWLADAVAATPPPMAKGRQVRLRYITQVAVGPPTFRVFTTGELAPGYLRYLERRLRESFGFAGTPLVITYRVRERWEERAAGRASR